MILLIISLDHASKFIFSSPITKFTNGIDSFWVSLKESRALRPERCSAGRHHVSVMSSLQRVDFSHYSILCVVGVEHQCKHASSMRMLVCSSRQCNFCMYCWFVKKVLIWYGMVSFFLFFLSSTESMRP